MQRGAVLVTMRIMRPAEAEGAATSQPTVVTMVQPAKAAVESGEKYYAVPTDQTVILVDRSKVPGEARLAFYRKQSPWQAQAIPAGPDAMLVRWTNGKPRIWGMSFGNDVQLPQLAATLLNIYSAEVVGDQELLKAHGDLAYVSGASVEKYLASIEQIVRAQNGAEIHLSLRDVERTAVVFRGRWKYTPVPDASVPRSNNGVLLYTMLPFAEGGGGGSGKLRDLAGGIENRLQEADRKPVVFETDGTPDEVSYKFNQEGEMDYKRMLDHVSEQTGLKWTEEKRAVRCLVIETK